MKLAALFLFLLACGAHVPEAATKVENAVVQIHCTAQPFLFNSPWMKDAPRRVMGTGFVVAGPRILTNAHVVSDARYIEIVRLGDDRKYVAYVQHIAHDCDLAVLDVQDKKEKEAFFHGLEPLEFGELPELNSIVATYGFPMGGTQISITRGVVSRIQQWTYSHSGSDAHLVIQTDAAINPGNSGGPVLQEGKVVGVAFQAFVQADNIGYLIPAMVVRHFLDDISDGRVDGWGELGLHYRHDLQNRMVRDILAVPDSDHGVVVTRVFPNMPAWGLLKPMDVILQIGDYPIGDDGLVTMAGRPVDFPEVMEREQAGSEMRLRVWRDKKEIALSFPLKRWDMVIPHSNPHDVVPNYYICGGLCFTPLSRGYLLTMGSWAKVPLGVRNLYFEAYGDPELVSAQEFPVLGIRLPDEINAGAEDYVGQVVEKVNGKLVRSLKDLKQAVENSEGDELNLEFTGMKIPLVLSKSATAKSGPEILLKYHVPEGERL